MPFLLQSSPVVWVAFFARMAVIAAAWIGIDHCVRFVHHNMPSDAAGRHMQTPSMDIIQSLHHPIEANTQKPKNNTKIEPSIFSIASHRLALIWWFVRYIFGMSANDSQRKWEWPVRSFRIRFNCNIFNHNKLMHVAAAAVAAAYAGKGFQIFTDYD